MAIKGLTIIGESINDTLLDPGDAENLKRLARAQDEAGASYIDVNLDRQPPAFMAETVRRIQGVTRKPLSIDTLDPEIAEAGLRAYDPGKADGKAPILNSVSLLRPEMLDLYKIRPFVPILMASEFIDGSDFRLCRTSGDTLRAAKELLLAVEDRIGIPGIRCILDPAIKPIACDTDGALRNLIGALRLVGGDPALSGIDMVVGMSNFTVMLPPKRPDGSPVKGPLESAFLTLAMPLGLNMIVGSTRRKYELLPAGHPAMRCLTEALELDDSDVVKRVREFYSF